jgi:hypothetical protein
MFGKRFQAGKIVHGQEIVDKRERRLHSTRHGLIIRGSEQRVEPDEPMTAPLQSRHFLSQQIGLAAIPAI